MSTGSQKFSQTDKVTERQNDSMADSHKGFLRGWGQKTSTLPKYTPHDGKPAYGRDCGTSDTRVYILPKILILGPNLKKNKKNEATF